MQDRFAVFVEPASAIGHQAFALGFADLLAKVGFARFAEFTLAAFRCVERDHMIAHGYAGNTFADGFDNAATFMAKHDGK